MRQLLILLLLGCASNTPNLRDHSDANAAVARREIEGFEGRGEVALAGELFTPGYRLHFAGQPTLDVDGHKQVLAGFRAAFPDLKIAVEHQVVEGDRVANHIVVSGTHQGPFNGLPATGKTIRISGNNLMRFENGRIAELWGHLDAVGLMTQLGAIPAPPGEPPRLQPLTAAAGSDPAADKLVVRRFIDAFNAKDVARLAREFHDDYVLDFPGGPRGQGVDGIRKAATEFIAAFPDLQFSVEDMVSQGGYVVWRWNLRGTHRGPLGPFPASNRAVQTSGISLLHVRGGKIVEDRVRADMAGLLQQIGALAQR
jgi:steroid delta-isomerase-like uncharacterized protein